MPTINEAEGPLEESITYTLEIDLERHELRILPPPRKRAIKLSENEVVDLISRLTDCIREWK